MNTQISTFFIVLLLQLFAIGASAQTDDMDFNRWVGNEPKDLPTLLKQFVPACERKYLPQIEKKHKPYDKAVAWTKEHCHCVVRFFNSKDDPMYVQVVNMEIRGALKALPPLPPELEIYVDQYEILRQDCEKNPKYISASEREMSPPAPTKKIQMRPGDRKKPSLPVRPQKSGKIESQQDEEFEARR